MPTRKISDLPKYTACRNSEHNPPSHKVFEQGIYEHVCPECGVRQVFTVGEIKFLETK